MNDHYSYSQQRYIQPFAGDVLLHDPCLLLHGQLEHGKPLVFQLVRIHHDLGPCQGLGVGRPEILRMHGYYRHKDVCGKFPLPYVVHPALLVPPCGGALIGEIQLAMTSTEG